MAKNAAGKRGMLIKEIFIFLLTITFFISPVILAESWQEKTLQHQKKTNILQIKKQNKRVKNMANDKYRPIFLKDYTPSSFLIEAANLQFLLDPQETVVNAKLSVKRNPVSNDHSSSITLDGVGLELKSVKINGQLLASDAYKTTPETLTILKVSDNFILETTVKIHPDKNLSLTGLYLTGGNFCTQNEPYGFRRLTYFIDRPDVLTKFTAEIIADKTSYPVLLSNGNLISKKDLENNKHAATWQDPFPKSAYLFALIAGNYGKIEDYYTTTSGRKITLRIFANPKQLDQCHHAMASLKQAMAWDEKTFGLEYDLDIYQIVAVDDFNAGAMENKSLNVFNSNLLLASPDTTTDDYFNRITSVIAHEYFHNWTGNRVTCRDWFQLGLKEGLTTLREQLFMEDTHGQVINRIDSINLMRTRQFAEDSGPLAHPLQLPSYIDVNNFYTTTVYEKSAEVCRMLSTMFGRETFQQIMRDFLKKFDGQPATIQDFLQIASAVTKADLKQFSLWVEQAGTPVLNIGGNYTDDKTYHLKVEQQHPKAKHDFYLPLVVGLVSPAGENAHAQTLIVDKKEQSFSFPGVGAKPIPSLLRSFSAPVKIEYQYTDDELLLLMINDQDPVNRWDASQKLMTNIFLRLYKDFVAKKTHILSEVWGRLFKTILGDNKIDPALAALMLQIPSDNYFLETLPSVDVETLHNVREFIKLELAKVLKTELLECYKNNTETKPYSIDPISMGKRALKNLCLLYLMHLNTPDIFELCLRQLERADNLTDVQACLGALANSNYDLKEKILETYYQRWQDQPNLVNKWLLLNATIKLPGTLQRVQQLMLHPAFNIKNPNKVRSLLRVFCENNLINFHLIDGAGYKFLADQVLVIDKFNPQLAASITIPLTQGQKFDKKRQQLMQQQLIRISQEPKLSKNVYEIVNKAGGAT